MNEPSGIRIGDEERDQAVSGLTEHFAAGRLTKAEYDERAEQALQARFRSDLDPLFTDLPAPQKEQQTLTRPITVAAAPPQLSMSPILMLFPMLLVGVVITAVVLHAPWMLFGVFWLFIFTGFGRRQRWHHDSGQQHQRWQQQQQAWQQQQRQLWQQQQQGWQGDQGGQRDQGSRQWHDEHEQHYR